MNIFRFVGDMTHLGSFVVLLLKILATRSCRGKGERKKRGEKKKTRFSLSIGSHRARRHGRSGGRPSPPARVHDWKLGRRALSEMGR